MGCYPSTKRTIVTICFVLIAFCSVDRRAQADDFDPTTFTDAQYAIYERQLNAILKTRRDQEKKFVAAVVVKVKEGKIPPKLVDTSYQWVRNRRPDTNYPFIYFEKVLRLQAGKLKIQKEVPAFNYSIYRSAGQKVAGANGTAGQSLSTTPTAGSKSAGRIRQ